MLSNEAPLILPLLQSSRHRLHEEQNYLCKFAQCPNLSAPFSSCARRPRPSVGTCCGSACADPAADVADAAAAVDGVDGDDGDGGCDRCLRSARRVLYPVCTFRRRRRRRPANQDRHGAGRTNRAAAAHPGNPSSVGEEILQIKRIVIG
jgi:hypothetical protein